MKTITTLMSRCRDWMFDLRLRRLLHRIEVKMNGLKTGYVKTNTARLP